MTAPGQFARRTLLAAGTAVVLGAGLVTAINAHAATTPAPRASASASTAPSPSAATDWSVAVIDSTLARSSADLLSTWDYPRVLFFYGVYLTYRRTGRAAYLADVRQYLDRFVNSAGHLNATLDSLDNMLGGNLLVLLYQATGDTRYRTAAAQIRTRLTTYPRTADGAFWHKTNLSQQVWGDGAFMADPFLARYGAIIGDSTALDEAARQITLYYSHLARDNGLIWHAYDASKSAAWADPVTGHSPESWCRAVGWFGMATVDVLDQLPAGQANRAALVTILRKLAQAFATYQDPASGRWFQVVDKGTTAGNWTETSCSSMYTYILSRGVQRGYLDAGSTAVAAKGYAGVLARLTRDASANTSLTDICIGTGPGDYTFYINRPRATNDYHGLGAFLIMSEQMHAAATG